MAFTVRLIKAGGNIDSKGVVHYSRTYQVESDDVNDKPGDVIAAGALAAFTYLSAHPDDSRARLKSKAAEQTSEFMIWEATFEWDTEQSATDRGTVGGGAGPHGDPTTHPSSPGNNTSQTSPELRPPKYEWGSVQTERLMAEDMTEDEDGNPAPVPVVNSAGIPFDPPPSVPCSDTTLSITLFQTTARPHKIRVYEDSVNEFYFLNEWPPGWVKITSYKQTSQYEASWGWFWEYQISFQMREGGWNPIRVLDAGTSQRIDTGGAGVQLKPILDAQGHPVTSPWPLDGNGAALPPGATPDDFVYLEFQGYRIRDWAYLISDAG